MKQILLSFLLAIPAFSQSAEKDALVNHWKVTGEFTLAVAKSMPAEKYGFRPVPVEMSFGQLMVHIAVADIGACATASGMPRPTVPQNLADALKDEKIDIGKEAAVSFVSDSFDFCNKAIASMNEAKLDAVVGGQRKMTGREWLWAYFTHTAHHRGQAEVYLRLKGIEPPDYVF
jgi:uncharacterized damage-inducible protein DinB